MTQDVAEVRLKVAAMGPNFDLEINEATRRIYRPLIQQSSDGIEISTDLAYGADLRQKLDVYRPKGRNLPILIYIPGGGFTGGDKNSDGVFYCNLGVYFARHGFLTIVANYRLTPAHVWPAGAEDVGGAVAWARTHGESYGGDVNRVFLYGQSAGASHAANYLFNPGFHSKDGAGITAAILMSGGYRVAGKLTGGSAVYFGADETQYDERSALTHVNKSKVPLLLSTSEFDPPALSAPTFELAQAVTLRDGKSPQVAWMKGHNHVSTVQSLGSFQDDVGAILREYLAQF